MLQADEKKIRALLFESGISKYRISKETGIPGTTISDIVTGKTKFDSMKFSTASKLTAFANSLESC